VNNNFNAAKSLKDFNKDVDKEITFEKERRKK